MSLNCTPDSGQSGTVRMWLFKNVEVSAAPVMSEIAPKGVCTVFGGGRRTGPSGDWDEAAPQVGVVGVTGVVRPAASISSMALQLGAHTACALPSTLRVFISERVRCLPHRKQDMVALPSDAPALKGEPEGLDL